MKGFNYYRIKMEWLSEKEDKSLAKTKTEELVFASSYSEAESVAYALIERNERARFGSVNFEIIKTKISELLYSNALEEDETTLKGLITSYFAESDTSGVGMYRVRVLYITIDEKTGKEKRSTENIFTPAMSNTDAASIVLNYLQRVGETRDYVVRDTSYDKAEAILWPVEVFNSQVNKMA